MPRTPPLIVDVPEPQRPPLSATPATAPEIVFSTTPSMRHTTKRSTSASWISLVIGLCFVGILAFFGYRYRAEVLGYIANVLPQPVDSMQATAPVAAPVALAAPSIEPAALPTPEVMEQVVEDDGAAIEPLDANGLLDDAGSADRLEEQLAGADADPGFTDRAFADLAAANASTQQASLQAKSQLDEAVAEMLADGEACFTRQEYTCALTSASNVLRLKPNDPDATHLKLRAQSAQAAAMQNIDIQ